MHIYPIAAYPWGGAYQPRAEASIGRTEGELCVRMTAWEPSIIAHEMCFGGPVCRDSCLEFFFQPARETDARYINIEVNPIGTMHIGIGEGRHGRQVLTERPPLIAPTVQIEVGKCWSVSYQLPFTWIASLFPSFDPGEPIRLWGNFYACDESIHPHFGCAFPIESENPDFHRPEWFQEILL